MSLETTISMYNQVTPVLKNIVASLNILISEAKATETATKNMISTEALNTSQKLLQEAGANLARIERGTIENKKSHQEYNEEVRKTPGFLSGALGQLKAIAATYLGIRGIKAFVGMSDEYSNMNARLGLVTSGQEEMLRLQDAIFRSAQDTGTKYTAMLDNFTKLSMQAGNAFGGSNEAVLEFSTLLNKQFAVAGTSGVAAESVMYNLTQALASGVLRGQDLNAVLQNTPQIARLIEDEMNIAQGSIKNAAEEGLITSDIVVRAILKNKEKIESQYNEMPLTFSRIATTIGNSFHEGLSEAFKNFSNFINANQFQEFVENAKRAGVVVADVIGGLLSVTMDAFNFIIKYGNIIAPMVLSIASAYGFWILQTKILSEKNIALMKSFLTNPYALLIAGSIAAIAIIKAVIEHLGLAKDGVEALTMAIEVVAGTIMVISGLMIALNLIAGSSPIGLILVFAAAALTLVLTLMYRWVESVGGLNVAWLITQNYFLSLYDAIRLGITGMINAAKLGAMSFQVAFMKAFDAVQMAWNALKMHVTNGIQILINNIKIMVNEFIEGVNTILGVVGETLPTLEVTTSEAIRAENQSAMESANAQATASTVQAEAQLEALRKSTMESAKEMQNQMQQAKSQREANIQDVKAQNLAKKDKEKSLGDSNDLEKLLNNLPSGEGGDLEKSLGKGGNKLDKIADNTEGIKKNTEWKNNDLTSLRDLMEQRAITNLSKDFKIEINNSFDGKVNSKIDEEEMATNVSNRIARQLELQFNAG